jgi:hypothetical protein
MASVFFRLLKEDDKGAALRALKKQEPKELILAIPVRLPDIVKQLGKGRPGGLPEHPAPLLGRRRFLCRL